MWENLFSLLSTLAVIVVILFLTYYFTRFIAGKMTLQGTFSNRRIKVLEQVSTGKDQKILFVQMGDDYYFLGASPGGITCLTQVDKEQVLLWSESEAQQREQKPTMSFAQALKKVALNTKDKGGQD